MCIWTVAWLHLSVFVLKLVFCCVFLLVFYIRTNWVTQKLIMALCYKHGESPASPSCWVPHSTAVHAQQNHWQGNLTMLFDLSERSKKGATQTSMKSWHEAWSAKSLDEHLVCYLRCWFSGNNMFLDSRESIRMQSCWSSRMLLYKCSKLE